MRIFSRLLTSALFIVGTSAQAATVFPEKGQILLNQGGGYKLVTEPTEAAAGNLVIANPGAVARVQYSDGCAVYVQPGSVFAIAAQAPCQQTGSHVETGGSLKDPPEEDWRQERPIGPLILGVGGAAIAVGAAVLLLRGKDNPGSP